MSGIYIPGMEMSKAGNWKTVRIYYDGTCATPNWQGDCTLIKGVEAVPVPDHGRLIDADRMVESLANLLKFPSNLVNGQWIVNTIREQPTIIPASGGDAE